MGPPARYYEEQSELPRRIPVPSIAIKMLDSIKNCAGYFCPHPSCRICGLFKLLSNLCQIKSTPDYMPGAAHF
jgi:hypothetical protein